MTASLRRAEFGLGAPYRPGLPPGVYEAREQAPALDVVRLDTAAFVGLARRGPLNTPVPLESFTEFEASFGPGRGALRLPEAVHAFFAEGGRRCIVVRCLDHGAARTARFVLPGLSIAGAAPPDAAARLAARNPGAWANGLRLRLRVQRRPLPIVRRTGSPLRWRVPAHRAVVGATLRMPGRVAGAPVWHLTRVSAVEQIDRSTALLTLAPQPGFGFRDKEFSVGTEELLLDLEVRLDGMVLERWTGAGLHADHPRYLPRLLGRRAQVEAYLPRPTDGSDAETEAGSPDRIWGTPEDPPGSALLRPSAGLHNRWLVPADALIAAAEGLVADGAALHDDDAGSDAAATTAREHFLDGTAVEPADLAADANDRFLVFARRPGALHSLAAWDERQPRAPIALVVLPDLLHPAPPDEAPGEPAADPGAPCFGRCDAPSAARSPTPPPYPLLGTAPPPAEGADESAAAPEEDPLADPVLGARLANPLLSRGLAEYRLMQARVVEHCEAAGTRIALLDLPPGLTPGEIASWRRALASDRAALFAPTLRAAAAGRPLAPPVLLSPAAAVAGIVARVERDGRPWLSPGNQEVRSAFAVADDPGLPDAGVLHEERIDVVRPTETGLRLMGSRTTSLDVHWTHLSVRRLIDWLKVQIALDLAFAPFEPNGPPLWAALERTAERRLRTVFDGGALAGRTAAQSYFARCDATTTPPTAQDQGQAILLVGVAPAVPAEFIVFRLVRDMADGGVEVVGP